MSSLRHSLGHAKQARQMPRSAKLTICVATFIHNLLVQPSIHLTSRAVRGVAICNSASLRRLLQLRPILRDSRYSWPVLLLTSILRSSRRISDSSMSFGVLRKTFQPSPPICKPSTTPLACSRARKTNRPAIMHYAIGLALP
jgi:hypothetical protein